MQCTLCLGQQVIDNGVVGENNPDSFHTMGAANRDRMQCMGLLYTESFATGLAAVPFYIHAMAGREALVEGATNTSQSGYAMRLGVKMMERDTVAYDHTVRIQDSNLIIQFA